MFDQHWASGNFDLLTAGKCSLNLSDTISNNIKRTALIPVTSAQLVRFYDLLSILYALSHYYFNYLYSYTHYFITRNHNLGVHSLQKIGSKSGFFWKNTTFFCETQDFSANSQRFGKGPFRPDTARPRYPGRPRAFFGEPHVDVT